MLQYSFQLDYYINYKTYFLTKISDKIMFNIYVMEPVYEWFFHAFIGNMTYFTFYLPRVCEKFGKLFQHG